MSEPATAGPFARKLSPLRGEAFGARLRGGPIMLAPGCYDGLSARLIEQAGFEAAYLSGASVAYTRFGFPDIGLVGMKEMAEVIGQIRETCTLPLVVDGDTGFGNALNVQRTVRAYAAAGADAIQLEDQTFPKRCGHLQAKSVIDAAEMAGKIRAAVDARPSENVLIIARTDAILTEGLQAALDRAELYRESGADVLFIEAPVSQEQMNAIRERFAGRVPLLANMVEGGSTPLMKLDALQDLGFRIAIYPGALVRALTAVATEFLTTLKRDGSTEAFWPRMLDFHGLNNVLGTETFLRAGREYQSVYGHAREV